ncbi:MAG TPA: DUF393 domain-containing protein [Gemmatimonadales bacterium]|nr:DUF393 domain-containing protein [Gemmatimonadales bacterium]
MSGSRSGQPSGVSLPDRPTLIYDGECGLCRQSVDQVRRWDRDGRIAVVPFQDREAVERFGIALPALAAAMHLLLPDGRVFAGADAVPELLKLLPGKGWLRWVFWLPGVRPVARRVYRHIAERRHCLARGVPLRERPPSL